MINLSPVDKEPSFATPLDCKVRRRLSVDSLPPFTCRLLLGFAIPTPTLPAAVIRIASTTSPVPSFVPMEISEPLVPSYDAIAVSYTHLTLPTTPYV